MKSWERNLGGQNEKRGGRGPDADRTRTGRGPDAGVAVSPRVEVQQHMGNRGRGTEKARCRRRRRGGNEGTAAQQTPPGATTCKPTTLFCYVLLCYVLFCSVLFY
eukprot:gene10555-biopygen253